jgi:predicted Fe-S protein YdhL (DUF1289 family)
MNEILLKRDVSERRPSPYKEICKLDTSASVCAGCGRTDGEIAEWGSATASRQNEIVRRSSAFMGSTSSRPAQNFKSPSAPKAPYCQK